MNSNFNLHHLPTDVITAKWLISRLAQCLSKDSIWLTQPLVTPTMVLPCEVFLYLDKRSRLSIIDTLLVVPYIFLSPDESTERNPLRFLLDVESDARDSLLDIIDLEIINIERETVECVDVLKVVDILHYFGLIAPIYKLLDSYDTDYHIISELIKRREDISHQVMNKIFTTLITQNKFFDLIDLKMNIIKKLSSKVALSNKLQVFSPSTHVHITKLHSPEIKIDIQVLQCLYTHGIINVEFPSRCIFVITSSKGLMFFENLLTACGDSPYSVLGHTYTVFDIYTCEEDDPKVFDWILNTSLPIRTTIDTHGQSDISVGQKQLLCTPHANLNLRITRHDVLESLTGLLPIHSVKSLILYYNFDLYNGLDLVNGFPNLTELSLGRVKNSNGFLHNLKVPNSIRKVTFSRDTYITEEIVETLQSCENLNILEITCEIASTTRENEVREMVRRIGTLKELHLADKVILF